MVMTRNITISLPDEDYDLILGYCDELDIKVSGFLRRCAKDVIETHLRAVGAQ